jgi:prepilin-type N-terminal cleavage/methylation domain-containing protein
MNDLRKALDLHKSSSDYGRGGNMTNQRGFTLLELMMVVCIIGVLSMVAMTEFNKIHDRAYVGAAMSDVQLFRKALSMYDAEWGVFPSTASASMIGLLNQLLDPEGQPYISPPSGDNFESFDYTPPAAGDEYGDYSLSVIARDHRRTRITVHWSQDVEYVKLN